MSNDCFSGKFNVVDWILQICPLMFQDGSYIFEFESYPDLHACREIIGKSQSHLHVMNEWWLLKGSDSH